MVAAPLMVETVPSSLLKVTRDQRTNDRREEAASLLLKILRWIKWSTFLLFITRTTIEACNNIRSRPSKTTEILRSSCSPNRTHSIPVCKFLIQTDKKYSDFTTRKDRSRWAHWAVKIVTEVCTATTSNLKHTINKTNIRDKAIIRSSLSWSTKIKTARVNRGTFRATNTKILPATSKTRSSRKTCIKTAWTARSAHRLRASNLSATQWSRRNMASANSRTCLSHRIRRTRAQSTASTKAYKV